jgi:hypothetical protein
MPKWFQQMVAPTMMLWLCALATGVISAIDPEGDGMPKRAEVIWNLAVSFVIASWVVADARKRGRRLCYDYDTWIYFAWPILAPIYLFQTRGARAFLTLLCFAVICLSALLPVFLVFIIRDFLQ